MFTCSFVPEGICVLHRCLHYPAMLRLHSRMSHATTLLPTSVRMSLRKLGSDSALRLLMDFMA